MQDGSIRRLPASALPPSAASSNGGHRSSDTHATVQLPPLNSNSLRGSYRGSPGHAVRTNSSATTSEDRSSSGLHSPPPPAVPPRPESTLSSRSRRILDGHTSSHPAVTSSSNTISKQSSGPGRGGGVNSSFSSTHSSSSSSSSSFSSSGPTNGVLSDLSPLTMSSNPSGHTHHNLPPPSSPISLTAPRPGQHRTQNLYVDAPLKSVSSANNPASSVITKQPSHQRTTESIQLPQSTKHQSTMGTGGFSRGLQQRSLKYNNNNNSGHILSQTVIQSPNSATSTLKKPKVGGHNADLSPIDVLGGPLSDFSLTTTVTSASSNSSLSDSIICKDCGLCRCEACRTPRKLPQKWLCGDKCLLSADTVVDAVSCMSCVKAVFYHCGVVDNEEVGVDKPCSCSAEHGCLRWGTISALSLLMPCLWCYLPLKGCVKVTERIYQKMTSTGCHCDKSNHNSSHQSEASSSSALSSSHYHQTINDKSSIGTLSSTIPLSPSSPADSEKRLLG